MRPVTALERRSHGLLTWHALVGVLLGFLVIPIAHDWLDRWSEAARVTHQRGTPVVRASGRVVERVSDSVVIHITGTKLRDCEPVGLQAFALDRTGVMSIADLEKVGAPTAPIVNRPVGPFDSGWWRVRPAGPTAIGVRIYVTHTCEGVDVRSVLAEVALDAAD